MPTPNSSESAPTDAEVSPKYLPATVALPPSPDAQLEFLSKLQRIFDEGAFTATYKFALLVALTELAVERGADDGRPLALRVSWIAERFAELYWPQTVQYSTGAAGATVQCLVHQLARTGWVRHVRENPRNRGVIREVGDLESFVFGLSRETSTRSKSDMLAGLAHDEHLAAHG